jgi:hypothetical protein
VRITFDTAEVAAGPAFECGRWTLYTTPDKAFELMEALSMLGFTPEFHMEWVPKLPTGNFGRQKLLTSNLFLYFESIDFSPPITHNGYMSKNNIFVKNLNTGDRFVFTDMVTVYTVESVRSGQSFTTITYTTDTGGRNEFVRRSMSTVTVLWWDDLDRVTVHRRPDQKIVMSVADRPIPTTWPVARKPVDRFLMLLTGNFWRRK